MGVIFVWVCVAQTHTSVEKGGFRSARSLSRHTRLPWAARTIGHKSRRGILDRCFMGEDKWFPRHSCMEPGIFGMLDPFLGLSSTDFKAIAFNLMECMMHRLVSAWLCSYLPSPPCPIYSLCCSSLPYLPMVPTPPAPLPLCSWCYTTSNPPPPTRQAQPS